MNLSTFLFLALQSLSATPSNEINIQDLNTPILPKRPSKGHSYSASIQKNDRHLCGGSLVAPSIVLTSAQCIQGHSIDTFKVRLGIIRLFQQGETIDSSEVIVHPEFDAIRKLNDIAIVKLSTPSNMTPAILDITNISTQVGTPALISGWDKYIQNWVHMFESELIVNENASCQKLYPEFDGQSSICMQGPSPRYSPCQGAEGSPVAVNNTLIGTFSSSKSCGGETMITRINHYIDWINQNKN